MQEPDNKDGYYYVSCVDYKRTGFILGPFKNDHAKALSMVAAVRDLARDKVPASLWYGWGTLRVPLDVTPPEGVFNKFFPECFTPQVEEHYDPSYAAPIEDDGMDFAEVASAVMHKEMMNDIY